MTVTTLPGDQFDRSTSDAGKAAEAGPVIITEGGKPAHVLLSITEYRRLTGGHRTIGEMLAMPGADEVPFDPPAWTTSVFEPLRSIDVHSRHERRVRDAQDQQRTSGPDLRGLKRVSTPVLTLTFRSLPKNLTLPLHIPPW